LHDVLPSSFYRRDLPISFVSISGHAAKANV
jgi:hypothetical protein